jgi:hypothetical protein
MGGKSLSASQRNKVYERVESFCEHGNEPSVSIQGEQFLD